MSDYSIIEVINQNLIVVNAGSSDGISEDLTFRIVFQREITDPTNSNISLGTLELVYGMATVVEVQSAFTTLKVSRATAPDDVPEELWTPDGWISTDCVVRVET